MTGVGAKGPNQRIEDQFFSADFDDYLFLPIIFKVLNTSKFGGPNGLKVGALLGRTPLYKTSTRSRKDQHRYHNSDNLSPTPV